MNPMTIVPWVLGSLSALSLLSIVAGRPWTLRVARRHNPPEVWSTPLFLETNMLITGVWALLFAVAAAIAALTPAWLGIFFGGLLFVFGRLSPRFGAWYAARRLRSMPA